MRERRTGERDYCISQVKGDLLLKKLIIQTLFIDKCKFQTWKSLTDYPRSQGVEWRVGRNTFRQGREDIFLLKISRFAQKKP